MSWKGVVSGGTGEIFIMVGDEKKAGMDVESFIFQGKKFGS